MDGNPRFTKSYSRPNRLPAPNSQESFVNNNDTNTVGDIINLLRRRIGLNSAFRQPSNRLSDSFKILAPKQEESNPKKRKITNNGQEDTKTDKKRKVESSVPEVNINIYVLRLVKLVLSKNAFVKRKNNKK